jgi:hypothetical protein
MGSGCRNVKARCNTKLLEHSITQTYDITTNKNIQLAATTSPSSPIINYQQQMTKQNDPVCPPQHPQPAPQLQGAVANVSKRDNNA